MIGGGAMLAAAGGSIYYLFAGIAMCVSAFLLWRGHPFATWVYVSLLLATLAWAIWEVGYDGWGLTVRLATLAVLGLPLLFRSIRGVTRAGPSLFGLRDARLFMIAGVVAFLLGSVAHSLRADRVDPLIQRGTLEEAPIRSRSLWLRSPPGTGCTTATMRAAHASVHSIRSRRKT